MADNLDDGNLDNPSNTQSENLLDEITPINEIKTVIPEQETKNMEVHHHPQLHHQHKAWKEYLLESLMIFIAVTLGFFAEQKRTLY